MARVTEQPTRDAELLRLAAEVEYARTHGLTALAAKEERAVDRDFRRWEATLRSAE